MFNFTGQARRRNVNLGNKSAITKQDLLLRAQQERERRARDRQVEAAAKVIQSFIRKYISCRHAINLYCSALHREQAAQLILVYGSKLVDHLNRQSLTEILHDSQSMLIHYHGRLGNVKLSAMLAEYGDDSLVIDTIKCMNMSSPTKKEFVEGLITFLKNTETLTAQSVSKICEVFLAWELNHSSYLIPLFQISSNEVKTPSVALDFYRLISSYQILPEPCSESSILLENLAYIYCHIETKEQVELCIAACFKGLEYHPQNPELAQFVRKLYEKPFIDKLANLVEEGKRPEVSVVNIVSFISCALDDSARDSIMITLLSRPSFLKKLYSDVRGSTFGVHEIQPSASFSIFIRLLEMYLLVSTDHELLSEYSGFTVNDLIAFTTSLKNFVFYSLWNHTAESRSKIVDDCLPLLQKLYLRDSRLHFCSTKNDLKYWSNNDPDFLQVSPFRYIEDYERLYREYADKREDAYTEDDDQFTTDELGSIKFHILNRLTSAYKSFVPTRQFKKLEILIKTPFFIPFEQRVDLFYMFIALDKQRLRLDDNSAMLDMLVPWNQSGMGRQSATISRENILEDACNAFNSIGERFKAKLSVTFVNEFGPEAGIDGGGITKEFLTSVSEEGFNNEKYALFQTNEQHELYPSTTVNSQKLRYLWFLGKILGKCLYDHVLIDVRFADFFLKKMLNPSARFASAFDDLYSLDAVLYTNLVKLLSMSSEQIEALDLSFEIDSVNGSGSVVELIPNGSHTRVRKENVLMYIIKVADFRLNKSLFRQIQNFHGGMSMIIAPHWMEMFNSVELQMLISGGGKDIDLKDLKANTEYGGYLETDKTIRDFWAILSEFEPEERLNFLKFVTSVPRAPLQGFASLEPKFGIRNAGRDISRLPTASTCVNLLKLPDYQDKVLLREKLLYSINSGARFDLS